MLGSVFKRRGVELGSSQDFSNLIRSFKATKQPRDASISWNLDVVLKWLTGLTYEPLHSISLKNLTKKTFSSSLAMAKQASELQAIDKCIGFLQGDAVCSFLLGFLAKNESPSNP